MDDIARTSENNFTIQGLRRRCAPKHRNSRRETAGWYRKIARGVCSLLKSHGPGDGMQNAKCIMQNRRPAQFFPANDAILAFQNFVWRYGLTIDEMEIATSSFASHRIPA